MQSQKQYIYSVILHAPPHITAAQLLQLCRREKADLAMGTVYRNLSALCEEGKLRCIETPGIPAIYDTTLTPHEHLICRRCGSVRDVQLPFALDSLLTEAAGEELTDYSLTMGCICPSCRARAENEK